MNNQSVTPLSALLLEGAGLYEQCYSQLFRIVEQAHSDPHLWACAQGCVYSVLCGPPSVEDVADSKVPDNGDVADLIDSYVVRVSKLNGRTHVMYFWCPLHQKRCMVMGRASSCIEYMNDSHHLTFEHIAATLSRYGL